MQLVHQSLATVIAHWLCALSAGCKVVLIDLHLSEEVSLVAKTKVYVDYGVLSLTALVFLLVAVVGLLAIVLAVFNFFFGRDRFWYL